MSVSSEYPPGVPSPSDERILIAVLVQAVLPEFSPKARRRILERAERILGSYAEMSKITRIRSPSHDAALAREIAAAQAWFKAVLPTFKGAGE